MPINNAAGQAKLSKLRELGFHLAGEEKTNRAPSEVECLMVSCPVCRAVRDEPCSAMHVVSTTKQSQFIHAERRELARHRINCLSNVDKALIVQYAFLSASASIAANSDKTFSKRFTPEEIEAFFVGQAIKELRELGALGH